MDDKAMKHIDARGPSLLYEYLQNVDDVEAGIPASRRFFICAMNYCDFPEQ